MSYTQAQLDSLKAALARGVLKVTVEDRTIVYTSPAEMREQIRIMEGELGVGSSRGGRILPSVSKGLD